MKGTNTGMSLAELLVIVCIIGIVGVIGLPAYTRFLQHNKLETLVDLLQGQIAYARASSVANRYDVELCGTVDGTVCSSSWERGWILRSPATGVVLNHHTTGDQQQLRWAGISKTISFRPNGTTKLGNGRFYICDQRGELVWQLVLNRQGRTKRIRGLEKGQQVSKPCG